MSQLAEALRAGPSFDAAAAAQMECIVQDLGRMHHERNDALREVTRAHHEVLLRLALALGQPAASARCFVANAAALIELPEHINRQPPSFNELAAQQ